MSGRMRENGGVMDLVEFLRARLDHIEDMARSGIAAQSYLSELGELLLREVGAKRRIIDLHEEPEDREARHGHWEGSGSDEHWVRDEPNECPECSQTEPCLTLRLLALPYADSPAYRDEWKP